MLLNQIGAEGNRSAKKAVGTGRKSVDSKGFSASRERETQDVIYERYKTQL